MTLKSMEAYSCSGVIRVPRLGTSGFLLGMQDDWISFFTERHLGKKGWHYEYWCLNLRCNNLISLGNEEPEDVLIEPKITRVNGFLQVLIDGRVSPSDIEKGLIGSHNCKVKVKRDFATGGISFYDDEERISLVKVARRIAASLTPTS